MNQEPMGPLMKATQKYVLTAVCVLAVILLVGAIRYIPVLYGSWLLWVCIILLILLLVVFLPVLKDMYREPRQ